MGASAPIPSGSNPVPGTTPGEGGGTPPPTTGSTGSGQSQGTQQGGQAAGGDAAVAEFFSTLDTMSQAGDQPDAMANMQKLAIANTNVVVRGGASEAMNSKAGQDSAARTDTAEQSSDQRTADQSEDSSRSNYRDSRARARGGDTRSGNRADARFSDLVQGGRQSASQSAAKGKAGRQTAMLSSMRARSGETPQAQRGRILSQTRPTDAQAQKAMQNLPPNIRQSLQANGRTPQAVSYLKFQMQMQRLQQMKQQAKESGDTELEGQIDQAMAELQAEAPEVPAELQAEAGDQAEGTEDVEEGGETGDGDSEDAGEATGLRRSQTVDGSEQGGEDGGGQGDAQGEAGAGAQVAARLGGSVSISALREGNVGIINTGGSSETGETDAEMSFDSAVLGRLTDGTLVTASSSGRARLLRVRERQGQAGGHSLDDMGLGAGGSDEDAGSSLTLAHVDSSSTTYFRTSDGRLLNIDQLQRHANEYLAEHPDADHIMIGDRRIGIEDITPNEAMQSGISLASLELAASRGVVRRRFNAEAQHLNPVHYQQTGMYSGMAFA